MHHHSSSSSSSSSWILRMQWVRTHGVIARMPLRHTCDISFFHQTNHSALHIRSSVSMRSMYARLYYCCAFTHRSSLSNKADEKKCKQKQMCQWIRMCSHRTIMMNTLSWSFSLANDDATTQRARLIQSDAFSALHSYIHFTVTSDQCVSWSWQWSLSEEFIKCSSDRPPVRSFSGKRLRVAPMKWRYDCVPMVVRKLHVVYCAMHIQKHKLHCKLIHGQTAS